MFRAPALNDNVKNPKAARVTTVALNSNELNFISFRLVQWEKRTPKKAAKSARKCRMKIGHFVKPNAAPGLGLLPQVLWHRHKVHVREVVIYLQSLRRKRVML